MLKQHLLDMSPYQYLDSIHAFSASSAPVSIMSCILDTEAKCRTFAAAYTEHFIYRDLVEKRGHTVCVSDFVAAMMGGEVENLYYIGNYFREDRGLGPMPSRRINIEVDRVVNNTHADPAQYRGNAEVSRLTPVLRDLFENWYEMTELYPDAVILNPRRALAVLEAIEYAPILAACNEALRAGRRFCIKPLVDKFQPVSDALIARTDLFTLRFWNHKFVSRTDLKMYVASYTSAADYGAMVKQGIGSSPIDFTGASHFGICKTMAWLRDYHDPPR